VNEQNVIHRMEHYPALKIESCHMNLEDIVSEVCVTPQQSDSKRAEQWLQG
jgi:hypothetical protein